MRTPQLLTTLALTGAALLSQSWLAASLHAAPLDLKWTTYLSGNDCSAPTLGPDDRIYVAVKKPNVADQLVTVVDQGTNGLLQTTAYSATALDFEPAAPAVRADGVAYLPARSSGPKGVHAVRLNGTASLVWYYETAQAGLQSSPAIGPDGTVYAATSEGDLHAIDPLTGGLKWVYARGGAPDSGNNVSPAVGQDGTVYFRQYGTQIHAVRPDGTRRWFRELDKGVNASPAIGPDGTIYVCSLGGVFALHPADGSDRWPPYLPNAQVRQSAPVLGPDGTLYFGASNKKLFFALNSATGTLKSTFTTDGYVYCSPTVAADGTVFFGCDAGYIYAVRLSGNQLVQVQKQYVAGKVRGAPAIGADGTVYVTTDLGFLWAFAGSGALARSAWPTFHQNPQRTGLLAASPVLAVTRAGGNRLTLTARAAVDRPRVLQVSTNLVDWRSLQTNTAMSETFSVTLTNHLGAGGVFHRVVRP